MGSLEHLLHFFEPKSSSPRVVIIIEWVHDHYRLTLELPQLHQLIAHHPLKLRIEIIPIIV